MCGRFAQLPLALPLPAGLPPEILHDLEKALEPRYNISPTQSAGVLRVSMGNVEAVRLRWGLRPGWMKDLKKPQPFNARIETVQTSGMYRAAYKARHAVVPAAHYYEWTPPPPGQKAKQPWAIKAGEDSALWLAGLWETWSRPEEGTVETFTIITREAEGLAEKVHTRMPVMLRPDDVSEWLKTSDPDVSMDLLMQPPPLLTIYPVSTRVNKSSEQGEDLAEPVGEAETG